MDIIGLFLNDSKKVIVYDSYQVYWVKYTYAQIWQSFLVLHLNNAVDANAQKKTVNNYFS